MMSKSAKVCVNSTMWSFLVCCWIPKRKYKMGCSRGRLYHNPLECFKSGKVILHVKSMICVNLRELI